MSNGNGPRPTPTPVPTGGGRTVDPETLAAIEADLRTRDGAGEDGVGGLQRGDVVFGFTEDGTRVRLSVGITPDGRIILADLETGQALAGVGGQFLTADNRVFQIDDQGNLVSAARTLTATERQNLGLGVGGAGAGGGGRTFAQEQQLLGQQQAFSREERIAQQEFRQRENRLAALDALTRDLANLQVRARTGAIESMGRSPFRGALRAQGAAPIGRDPFRRVQQELMGFAEAEVPTVGPQATTPQIEQAIGQTGGMIQNVPRRPLGLAHGGVIDMKRAADGAFAMRNRATGELGDSVLVGEAGPEVVNFSPDGRIVIEPLSQSRGRIAGRAQFGATLAPPDDQFAGESLQRAQVLAPIFGAAGFEDIPLITRGPAAFGGMLGSPLAGTGVGLPTPAGAGVFERLGTRPNLVFDPSQGFMSVSPQGEIRVIGSAENLVALGLNPTDAVTMSVGDLKAQGFRMAGEGAEPNLLFERRGRFGEMAPIVAPLSPEQNVGILLPDPRLLARVWRDLDPATQGAVISAYGTAGVQAPELESRLRFFTPGTGRRQPTASIG